MWILLLILPVFIFMSALYLYRFSGRREFLHFDLVQFLYAFVIYPIGFLWLRNFLYFLLKEELGVSIRVADWIVLDSICSVFFLYFYAFGIIHSLTKSFQLKLNRDPLFDLFEQSQYFHEFLSHVGMYVGLFIVISLLSVLNSFIPIDTVSSKQTFYAVLGTGFLVGVLLHAGLFSLTDKGVQYTRYRRIMKLLYGCTFLLHLCIYTFVRPRFSLDYGFFWFCLTALSSLMFTSFVFQPMKRFQKILELLSIGKGID